MSIPDWQFPLLFLGELKGICSILVAQWHLFAIPMWRSRFLIYISICKLIIGKVVDSLNKEEQFSKKCTLIQNFFLEFFSSKYMYGKWRSCKMKSEFSPNGWQKDHLRAYGWDQLLALFQSCLWEPNSLLCICVQFFHLCFKLNFLL